MVSLLYCRPKEVPGWLRWAEKREGERIVIRNAARWDHTPETKLGSAAIERIYVSQSSMHVIPDYEGILPVEILGDGPKPIETLPDLTPEPDGAPPAWLPDGYTIERAGTSWFRVIGPLGAKVGAAKRTEDEARDEAWNYYQEVSGGGHD